MNSGQGAFAAKACKFGGQKNMLARLGISVGAGFGTASVVAVTVAVVDMYVTGHGYCSITREVLTWPQAGIHLSIADVAMLVAAFAVAVSTWYFTDGGV